MIIINGAGSILAQSFITKNKNDEIIAISRDTKIVQKNVRSININSNKSLEKILLNIMDKEIVWINFQAIKFDELLLNTSLHQMRESLEINFLKNFIATKTLISKMIKNKSGKFIFLDSVKASMGDIGCAAYASSKSANRSLMQSIVKEYSRFNITCNMIAIGFSETPMLNSIPQNKRNILLKDVPGKKLVESYETNNAINFILSNESINGHILNLDGGLKNAG